MEGAAAAEEVDAVRGEGRGFGGSIEDLQQRLVRMEGCAGGAHLSVGFDGEDGVAVGEEAVGEHAGAGADVSDVPVWSQAAPFAKAWQQDRGVVALEALLCSFTPNIPSLRDAYDKYRQLPKLLPRDYRREEIAEAIHLTWPEFLGLLRSNSQAPLAGDPRFPAFEHALQELFDHYAVAKRITLATRYWINAGRLV